MMAEWLTAKRLFKNQTALENRRLVMRAISIYQLRGEPEANKLIAELEARDAIVKKNQYHRVYWVLR